MSEAQVDTAVEVIVRAAATIDSQQRDLIVARRQIQALEGKVELLMKYAVAVEDHNTECKAICNEGANCGYEGFLRRTKRRCAECPMRSVIDIMPHRGSA